MDAAEEWANWDEAYIGLNLAAAKVWRVIDSVVEMPSRAGPNAHWIQGSPDIWDDIAGFLQAILSGTWVATTWGYLNAHIILPVEAWIQNTLLGPFLAWVRSAGSGPIHFAYDILVQFVGWAGGYLTSFVNWMWSLPSNLAGGFVGWFTYGQEQIERLATWWNTTIWPGISALIDTLTSLPANLWETALGWFGWTNAQVERLAAWWGVTIWPAIGGLIETLTSLPADLWQSFLGWFGWTGAQVERLATWWAGLPGFLGTTVLPLLWTTIDEWVASPGGSFKGVWDRLGDLASEAAIDSLEGVPLVVQRLTGAFATLPSTYLNYVARTAGTNLAEEPWRAFTTTGTLYMLSMAAGSAAHGLATALNLLPTLNWVGASQLAGFIAEAAGFERITDATYGVLLNDALAWPLRYYWNEMLRPKLPTEGTIFLMGRKRGLTREEFGEAMAKQGHPDSWIDRQYQFFWTDPSPYWLLRMSEHATPELLPSAAFLPWLEEWLPGWRSDPFAWFKMKLMLAGFEDTDIPAFIEGFQRRRLGTAVTQVKTSIRAMVREGYWGRTEARAALRPMGVQEGEIEYLILAEEIDYQNRYLDDQVRYYTEAYRKGEISKQDFALVLSTMIVKAERVAQIVAREDTRKLPKLKPLVEAAQDPLVKSLVRQAVTSWTKGYRDWELDLEDLRLGLNIVLQNVELVRAMVDVEATRYRPEPAKPRLPPEDPLVAASRRAAVATTVQRFRQGEISAGELEIGLVAMIPVPELAVQIRTLEELRLAPVPGITPLPEEDPAMAEVRKQRVRGHLEMFRKRLIGVSELYMYLAADGLAPALAYATAITESYKRIRLPPLDSAYFTQFRFQRIVDEARASYDRMFQLGEIGLEEYEAYLAGTGVDPAVISYWGDMQDLRRFLEVFGPAD